MPSADIGLIGLAVMGQNLVLNINDHGYSVAVYNRTIERIDEFLAGPAKDTKVVGARSIEELLGTLKSPRTVMLMVKAGPVVDAYIDQLVPHMKAGDIIVTAGVEFLNDQQKVKLMQKTD